MESCFFLRIGHNGVCILQACTLSALRPFVVRVFRCRLQWPTRSLPQITVEGATPIEGGKVAKGMSTLPPPLVPHQRAKKGRSLHQHPSRAARRRAGRGGDTRGAASHRFFAADAENACRSASNAAFRESPEPQRNGLRPLREKRCGCRKHVRSKWPTPPL